MSLKRKIENMNFEVNYKQELVKLGIVIGDNVYGINCQDLFHIATELKEKKYEYPTNLADYAIQTNQILLLRVLTSQNIFPSYQGVAEAAEKNHLHIIAHIYDVKSDIFTQEFLNGISGEGSLDTLQFLYNKNPLLLPDEEGAGEAAYHKKENVVKFLHSKSIIPNIDMVNIMIADYPETVTEIVVKQRPWLFFSVNNKTKLDIMGLTAFETFISAVLFYTTIPFNYSYLNIFIAMLITYMLYYFTYRRKATTFSLERCLFCFSVLVLDRYLFMKPESLFNYLHVKNMYTIITLFFSSFMMIPFTNRKEPGAGIVMMFAFELYRIAHFVKE